MRTFHLDEAANNIVVTEHPIVRAQLLEDGCLVMDTARAARQYAMRHGSSVEEINWTAAEHNVTTAEHGANRHRLFADCSCGWSARPGNWDSVNRQVTAHLN